VVEWLRWGGVEYIKEKKRHLGGVRHLGGQHLL